PLQWLPDGSGWLLHYKYLLDRKSKLIVWEVDPKSLVASTVRLEEEGTFSAVARTGGGYRYVKRRFPREAIEKATAEYIAAGPLVRPKRRISLTFDIKNVLDGTAEKLIEEYRQMWKSKF